ncbi:MAG TPA: orotate phosphoribosyltransferase, partial [Euryarchaeota archaeon]|nr:orotate phosphoribosyltransferase [Euryarchaeota archaeon]
MVVSKEALAKKLVEIGAIRFGTFILKSGRVSNYYVDIKYAST